MPLHDLIAEQDELKTHEYSFFLWPKLWRDYTEQANYVLVWEVYVFTENEADNIPEEPGLYTFLIQPRIAEHPSCSYLMYIGKTNRTLRDRFKEYFREKATERGRPKIIRLLNKYPDHLYFGCSVVPKRLPLDEIEDALINAWLPPCNDQLPATVSRVRGGLV